MTTIAGYLRRNDRDRWEIVSKSEEDRVVVELTSGSVCEVQIGGHWIRMCIESYHGSRPASGALASVAVVASYDGYCHAAELCILLCEGLPARVTDRRDWDF